MPCTSDVASLRFSSSGMRGAWSRTISVVIARGIHLFPFRTEKLSLSAPMVLGLKGPGRVGRRRLISTQGPSERAALRRSVGLDGRCVVLAHTHAPRGRAARSDRGVVAEGAEPDARHVPVDRL